ncbi:MAG: IPT/TIG domain-containing protein [Ignavibacteriales bacterium]|nr:IPT/TIG domain-containing protein [Ignavibacteriales bacterium]
MKFFLATLYIAILGISACEDMGDPVSPPSTSAPSITSIIPDSGNVGDTVRIVGKNFTSTTGSVKFGTLSADVIVSWSDTLLRVKVPAGAATGNVLVTAGSKNSNGKQFMCRLPSRQRRIQCGYPCNHSHKSDCWERRREFARSKTARDCARSQDAERWTEFYDHN